MPNKTRKWLLFVIGWYMVMFILVPPNRGPRLSPFGFWLGFVQAALLNWITVHKYELWRFPGEIFFLKIPVLTSLAWIPPSILFANYYPSSKGLVWKVIYIVTFAAGTALAQHFQRLQGMWENIRWKDLYTFPLALLTHSLMAFLLPLFNLNKDQR